MTPESWREVERLVHEAIRLTPDTRSAFLSTIRDPDIHAEVASLIAADSGEDGTISAIIGQAAQAAVNEHAVGEQIGHYQITAMIGSGGIGVVYRAEDLRLNRAVAIKFLNAGAAPEDSWDRIRREARAASTLNHPGVCTVYDVGEHNGAPYLVMEFVEGPTLAAIIQQGPLKLDDVLRIGIQIADALAAAHQKGIIHRDLKPANIKIKPGGGVKILDFGLAKRMQQTGAAKDPGVTMSAKSLAGKVMGTAAYMSPEQAEGKPLDARTDIFSFGAVLYEMATGRRAFRGDSPVATMAAILTSEPTLPSKASPSIPVELDRIINRCLRKDSLKRLQHMADVKVLLEALKDESATLSAQSSISRQRKRWIAAIVSLMIVVAAAGLWLSRGRDDYEEPRVLALTTFAGSENYPSFSPDGNQVVFSWNGETKDNWDLYVKLISGATTLRLTTDAADDLFPAWSPSGGLIAFLKFGQPAGIYLTSPLGGPEQKVADFDVAQGAPAWSPAEKYLVVAKCYREEKPAPDAGALFLIPLQGGEPRPILSPPHGKWYQYPAFDPTGRSLAFASCEGPAYGRYCDIMRVALNSALLPEGAPQKAATVSATVSGLVWSADGNSLIYSAGNLSTGLYLWNVSAAKSGAPKRLEIASSGALYPAVARKASRLGFARWLDDQDVWRVSAGGAPQPLLVSSMLDASPCFSPDGRRIAFASARGVDRIAIWLSDADGGGLVQLTRGPESYHGSPRWSPDGHWIAFDARGRDGRWNIKVIESSGGEARQLTSGPFTSTAPRWSQDAKWIYFASDRTGRFEIWRVPAEGGSAQQVTQDGGYVSLESIDGQTLYYTKTGDPRGGPLFGRPLAGTGERQVVERVVGRAFAVFADGVYYLDSTAPGKQEIRWHDFATRRTRVVSPIEGDMGIGFTVSPDRTTFLFTRLASPGSDLMLIENPQ
jgi:eukaryotic-like serine/threonine-protein kinase